MTKERLIGMMDGIISGCTFDKTRENRKILASRILAALEEERKGEVVIGQGEIDVPCNGEMFIGDIYLEDKIGPLQGKKGSLIFREDK